MSTRPHTTTTTTTTRTGHHAVAEWVEAVAEWTPLRIATACRLRHVVQFLAGKGRNNYPDGQGKLLLSAARAGPNSLWSVCHTPCACVPHDIDAYYMHTFAAALQDRRVRACVRVCARACVCACVCVRALRWCRVCTQC